VTPLTIAVLVFMGVAGTGLVGQALRLKEHHTNDAARGVVSFTQTALVSLASLVLGLLVAGAKDHHRSQSEQVKELSTTLVTLNRLLEEYGPEAAAARVALRHAAEGARQRIWDEPEHGALLHSETPVYTAIANLAPATQQQTFLQREALVQVLQLVRIASNMATTDGGLGSRSVLLMIVVTWYVFLFFANGLFARPNPIAIMAMLVGAAAVASAVLMVLELDRPFGGMLSVSDASMRTAIKLMDAP